jgi:hypothetical protein
VAREDTSMDKLVTLIIAVGCVLIAGVSYDLGQKSIMLSCKHVSFFYYGDEIFECLPYKKGMLEHEVIPDLTPPR